MPMLKDFFPPIFAWHPTIEWIGMTRLIVQIILSNSADKFLHQPQIPSPATSEVSRLLFLRDFTRGCHIMLLIKPLSTLFPISSPLHLLCVHLNTLFLSYFFFSSLFSCLWFLLYLSSPPPPSQFTFTCRNATEVMDTPGWSNLVTNHPTLVGDAFKALALLVLPRKRRRLSSDQTSSTS